MALSLSLSHFSMETWKAITSTRTRANGILGDKFVKEIGQIVLSLGVFK